MKPLRSPYPCTEDHVQVIGDMWAAVKDFLSGVVRTASTLQREAQSNNGSLLLMRDPVLAEAKEAFVQINRNCTIPLEDFHETVLRLENNVSQNHPPRLSTLRNASEQFSILCKHVAEVQEHCAVLVTGEHLNRVQYAIESASHALESIGAKSFLVNIYSKVPQWIHHV